MQEDIYCKTYLDFRGTKNVGKEYTFLSLQFINLSLNLCHTSFI